MLAGLEALPGRADRMGAPGASKDMREEIFAVHSGMSAAVELTVSRTIFETAIVPVHCRNRAHADSARYAGGRGHDPGEAEFAGRCNRRNAGAFQIVDRSLQGQLFSIAASFLEGFCADILEGQGDRRNGVLAALLENLFECREDIAVPGLGFGFTGTEHTYRHHRAPGATPLNPVAEPAAMPATWVPFSHLLSTPAQAELQSASCRKQA